YFCVMLQMKFLITLVTIVIALPLIGLAQTATPTPTPAATAPTAKAANPADVESIDAILKAVYDVISGDSGQKRDWDRMRSLFHKDAKLIPTGRNSGTGITAARFLAVEDYIRLSGPTLERDGFHEREIARKVEQYGTMAHVFSTYAAFRKKDDATPFMRGINS